MIRAVFLLVTSGTHHRLMGTRFARMLEIRLTALICHSPRLTILSSPAHLRAQVSSMQMDPSPSAFLLVLLGISTSIQASASLLVPQRRHSIICKEERSIAFLPVLGRISSRTEASATLHAMTSTRLCNQFRLALPPAYGRMQNSLIQPTTAQR